MTVIPPPLQTGLKTFDRIFGPIALLAGIATLVYVGVWEFRYLAERGIGALLSEWAYWSPVLIFLPPAVHLICFGREMTLNRGVSLLVRLESIFILIGLVVVAAIVFG